MINTKFKFLPILAGLAACQPNTDPKAHLSDTDQTAFLERVAPYIAPPPENVKGPQRLEATHAPFYKDQAKHLELKAYHDHKDTAYFMVYRIAPSNQVKKIAVAGKAFPAKGQGDFSYYSEAFWTFKMPETDLNPRAEKLFETYLRGGDLTDYSNPNSPENWVEFPNEDTRFNTGTRTWIRGYATF